MARLAGLVVKASASRAEGPGFESRLRPDFSGSSYTSDLSTGTPVAPGRAALTLVVKASASEAEDPGFESRLRPDFSGSSYTSDL